MMAMRIILLIVTIILTTMTKKKMMMMMIMIPMLAAMTFVPAGMCERLSRHQQTSAASLRLCGSVTLGSTWACLAVL